METLFEKIERGHLWKTPGGIHPPSNKKSTNTQPIASLPLAERLIIPIKQHIGNGGKLTVQVGDHVLKGQELAHPVSGLSLPVHASTSGKIVDIKPMPSPHPSSLPELSIILEPDGKDEWKRRLPIEDYHDIGRDELVQILQQSGIAGLGGAGFPSYIKAQISQSKPIEYLIINAVECEPYITADDVLMQSQPTLIRQGVEVLCHLLNPKKVIIGIEDDKPNAVAAMKSACKDNKDIVVTSIPTKYPSGGEKQLIQVLTGLEVPKGGMTADIGVVVQNVGTTYAIANAIINGEPLISRVVTVAGQTLNAPKNYWVPLGTPISHLLKHSQFVPESNQRVIMGGPMMGFTLPHLNIPVVKITNCILAPSAKEMPPAGKEMECIRCSACADACPVSLLPQQLQWYAKAKDHEKSKEYNLFDCIECGACAYVCPSEIPLVEYYRVEKATIKQLDEEHKKAEKAKVRFEARNERLERDKQERQEKHKLAAEKRKNAMANSDSKDKVAAALARVKAKQNNATDSNTPDATDNSTNAPAAGKNAAVAAAIARAKAKKEAQTESNNTDETNLTSSNTQENTPSAKDPKKAAVAAAIARAKAKKEAQAQSNNTDETELTSSNTQENTPSEQDPKKAAVAAAIARAKAKKEAKLSGKIDDSIDRSDSSDSTDHDELKESAEESSNFNQDNGADKNNTIVEKGEQQDPKKAAVAAAIARAKDKKEAKLQSKDTNESHSVDANLSSNKSTEEDQVTQDPETKRKQAIAAAIAKAKAKKEKSGNMEDSSATTEQSDKKAKIAAAIAKAKAKRQEQDSK